MRFEPLQIKIKHRSKVRALQYKAHKIYSQKETSANKTFNHY